MKPGRAEFRAIRMRIVSGGVIVVALGAIVLSAGCLSAPPRNSDSSSAAWYEKGMGNAADLRYAEAIECFDRALIMEPDNEKALAARGAALLTVGRYEDAYRDLSRAIGLNPSDITAYYTRGLVYEQANNYENAAADYTSALVIEPDNIDCLFRRGLAYREMGKTDEAAADFHRACELGYGYACGELTRD